MIGLETPCLLAVLALLPQGDDELVARYLVGGRQRALSKDAVALELARHARATSRGQAAIDHLVEVKLVERAAKTAGMAPSLEQARAKVRQIEATMKAQRIDFGAHLDRSRMTREELVENVALGLLQARLCARVLGLDDPDAVEPSHLALWTKEQRSKATIATDPTQLPAGTVATVDGSAITALEMGRVLLAKVEPNELQMVVYQMVFADSVAHAAREADIEVTNEELAANYQGFKRRFEADPKSKGVSYERWLAAMGRTKESQTRDPGLIARLRHKRLVEKAYPPAKVEAILAAEEAAMLRRHGARRDLSILFLRALEHPNQLVRRDFAEAMQQAAALRERVIDKRDDFARVARTNSDDPDTKVDGGDVGWQHREYLPDPTGKTLPPEVLAAAFELEIGGISAPIRTEAGAYLVWVKGIEPSPSKEVLYRRILGEMSQRYNAALFEAAKIEMVIE